MQYKVRSHSAVVKTNASNKNNNEMFRARRFVDDEHANRSETHAASEGNVKEENRRRYTGRRSTRNTVRILFVFLSLSLSLLLRHARKERVRKIDETKGTYRCSPVVAKSSEKRNQHLSPSSDGQ